MEERPLDDHGVQLPGRLMAIEIILVLLLRQKSNAGRLLADAERILTAIEANEMANGPPSEREQALNYFAVARISIDKFAEEARRR